jgi:rod shape determining protein RodA
LPLPFMSYGGSFMISCLIMIGILINLKAHGHNL